MNDREFASVLTSWKEIARYVGRGIRTVQRWEQELGFPVRRTKQGSLLAVPGEIDSWVKLQQLTDGRLDLASLRVLRTEIRELRSENRELLRQLAHRTAKHLRD